MISSVCNKLKQHFLIQFEFISKYMLEKSVTHTDLYSTHLSVSVQVEGFFTKENKDLPQSGTNMGLVYCALMLISQHKTK